MLLCVTVVFCSRAKTLILRKPRPISYLRMSPCDRGFANHILNEVKINALDHRSKSSCIVERQRLIERVLLAVASLLLCLQLDSNHIDNYRSPSLSIEMTIFYKVPSMRNWKQISIRRKPTIPTNGYRIACIRITPSRGTYENSRMWRSFRYPQVSTNNDIQHVKRDHRSFYPQIANKSRQVISEGRDALLL